MATTRLWIGGATAVAQVDTITLGDGGGGWTGGGTIRTTMTAEDGTTTANVDTTSVAGTIETNRNNHLTNLQAATNSLFTAVTWTSSGTASILGTAVNAGIPFYSATTEFVNDATGTIASDSTTTANSGPNDWNSTANWTGATLPVDTDTVIINEGSHDILFGLDQNAIELAELLIGPGYTGMIGDSANGYYLQIDTTTRTRIASASPSLKIRGILVAVNVVQLPQSQDALWTGGDIDNLRITGSTVLGKITIRASTVLDNLYVTSCPAAVIEMGTDVTSWDILEAVDGGHITIKSGNASLDASIAGRTTLIYDEDADEGIDNLYNRGGTIQYNGTGAIATKLYNYAGHTDFTRCKANASATVAVAATEIWSGQIDAQANVTFTGNIIRHGGVVNAATGNTVNVSA